MMLHALVRYYQRLEQDVGSSLAPFGFSQQKIAFCVVLEIDGKLVRIEPRGREERGRLIPELMRVPGDAKPSGQGINPCFLWDNLAYLLGYKADDPKPVRTTEAFAAFRRHHLDLEQEIGDEHFSAVCRFLETWTPQEAAKNEDVQKLARGFGVFLVRGTKQYVHQRPKVQRWWRSQLDVPAVDPASSGRCLVTGQVGPLARLHEPAIKGVSGAQSSGAKIVSFNCNAFESYGKVQGFNAPVSQLATFQYCTALNHLLAADSRQKLFIGDTTVVFWTEVPTPAEELCRFVAGNPETKDDKQKERLVVLFDQIAQGEYPRDLGPKETAVYILGLSPNAARISVRFWLASTLGEVMNHIGEHYRDFKFQRGPRGPNFPSAYQILRESVREAKDIPPLLEGSLLRAIWTGVPYPEALYVTVLRRFRTDRKITALRVATLKAVLHRKHRLGYDRLQKELAMALDVDRPEAAYQMGRLFAVLERTQEQALPSLKGTIRDRYFGAALARPDSAFPRIIRLNQHHLGKLETGGRVFFERLIHTIGSRLDGFPSHLSLKDQGLFAIGYYHQREDLFT